MSRSKKPKTIQPRTIRKQRLNLVSRRVAVIIIIIKIGVECNGWTCFFFFVSCLFSAACSSDIKTLSRRPGMAWQFWFPKKKITRSQTHSSDRLYSPSISVIVIQSRLVSLSALKDIPKSTPVQFLHYTLIQLPTFAVTDSSRMNY